jgi:hypothetical protein
MVQRPAEDNATPFCLSQEIGLVSFGFEIDLSEARDP